jgi:hypothetical protein
MTTREQRSRIQSKYYAPGGPSHGGARSKSMDFPMPNDSLAGATVVASVEYTDDVALVLLLNPEPFYFTVTLYRLDGGGFDVIGTYENIVPAVREYEQNGGDY